MVELRLERARTTRDIDLRLVGSPDNLLATLQTAARLDLDDFLTLEIARDAEHPDIRGEGIQYEGMRFRAECRLAGKPFGNPFSVNIAFGEPIHGHPDTVTTPYVLGFAGITPGRCASTRSRRTSQRSSMRTPCRARVRTRA